MNAVLGKFLNKKFLVPPVLFLTALFIILTHQFARQSAIRFPVLTLQSSATGEKRLLNVSQIVDSQLTFERRIECNSRTKSMCYSTNKSLVVTFWEEKSKEKWVSQNILSAFPRHSFEHLIFVYDNSTWHAHPGHEHFMWIHVRGQHRYWYLKRFLSPKLIQAYEYVWIIDNDAQLDFQPLHYQCVVKHLKIELSAPSRMSGALSHAITSKYMEFVNKTGRWTDFVETGPLVVATSLAWQCIHSFIDPTLAPGWGIDLIWCNGIAEQCISPARSRKVCGVLDAFGLHHQSPTIQSFADGTAELSLYYTLYANWSTKYQILGPLAENNKFIDACRT